MGGRAGTSRVSDDVHSDATRNLLRKKVAEVLKKDQRFCRKDGVLEGQVPEIIPGIFQQTPVCSQIVLKDPYFGSLLPRQSVYETY